MDVGYARVSTTDQNLDGQIDMLEKAGCEKIFVDKASGAKKDRQALNDALEYMRSGDTLVVCRLDRLGRSVRQLIDFINELKEHGIGFKSLTEAIDTSTPSGQFFFHITAAFAELERNMIRERTRVGLDAARARGRKGGRKKVIDKQTFKTALQLYEDNKTPVTVFCKQLGISRRTFYRYLEEHKEAQNS